MSWKKQAQQESLVQDMDPWPLARKIRRLPSSSAGVNLYFFKNSKKKKELNMDI